MRRLGGTQSRRPSASARHARPARRNQLRSVQRECGWRRTCTLRRHARRSRAAQLFPASQRQPSGISRSDRGMRGDARPARCGSAPAGRPARRGAGAVYERGVPGRAWGPRSPRGEPRTRAARERATIHHYRALCLLALNRPQDATAAIEAMVGEDPLYFPPQDELSPRTRQTFLQVQRRVLPSIAQERYARAKSTYEEGRPKEAVAEFDRVLEILDAIAATGDAPPADGRPARARDRLPAAGLRGRGAGRHHRSPRPHPTAASPAGGNDRQVAAAAAADHGDTSRHPAPGRPAVAPRSAVSRASGRGDRGGDRTGRPRAARRGCRRPSIRATTSSCWPRRATGPTGRPARRSTHAVREGRAGRTVPGAGEGGCQRRKSTLTRAAAPERTVTCCRRCPSWGG